MSQLIDFATKDWPPIKKGHVPVLAAPGLKTPHLLMKSQSAQRRKQSCEGQDSSARRDV